MVRHTFPPDALPEFFGVFGLFFVPLEIIDVNIAVVVVVSHCS